MAKSCIKTECFTSWWAVNSRPDAGYQVCHSWIFEDIVYSNHNANINGEY